MDENFDYVSYIFLYDRTYDGGYIKHIFGKNTFRGSLGHHIPITFLECHDSYLDYSKCLGHAVLEDSGNGVVAKCKFNDSETGKFAKEQLTTTDNYGLSFYATGVRWNGPNVMSGDIVAVKVVPKSSVLVPVDA